MLSYTGFHIQGLSCQQKGSAIAKLLKRDKQRQPHWQSILSPEDDKHALPEGMQENLKSWGKKGSPLPTFLWPSSFFGGGGEGGSMFKAHCFKTQGRRAEQ